MSTTATPVSSVVVRVRFHGADIDFVKALQFPLSTSVEAMINKIDSIRVAAGWCEEKPIQVSLLRWRRSRLHRQLHTHTQLVVRIDSIAGVCSQKWQCLDRFFAETNDRIARLDAS
jgi:hypothetical protein